MTLRDKDPPKMLLSSLSVGYLQLGRQRTHKRNSCFPSETLLEKTKFSFASGYQLEMVSGLGMRACVHFFQL